MFSLKKLVDFSLRGGSLGYGCRVSFLGFLKRGSVGFNEPLCAIELVNIGGRGMGTD